MNENTNRTILIKLQKVDVLFWNVLRECVTFVFRCFGVSVNVFNKKKTHTHNFAQFFFSVSFGIPPIVVFHSQNAISHAYIHSFRPI